MSASFNGNPCTTIIICCNNPTNAIDETDFITYNLLSSLVRCIPKQNVLIIGEDMNAQIGKEETNKFCLHNSSNRNEEYLTDFSLESKLIWLNTKFFKKWEKIMELHQRKLPESTDRLYHHKQVVDK